MTIEPLLDLSLSLLGWIQYTNLLNLLHARYNRMGLFPRRMDLRLDYQLARRHHHHHHYYHLLHQVDHPLALGYKIPPAMPKTSYLHLTLAVSVWSGDG